MNHLLEAWITWIKYKPYFTAKPNSKHNALQVWSRGGSKQHQKKRRQKETYEAVCYVKVKGEHIWEFILQEAEGGTRAGNGQQRKKMKRAGGSKGNDSHLGRVMCLISLRNWEEWEMEGCMVAAQVEYLSVSLSTPVTSTVHEKQEDFVLVMTNEVHLILGVGMVVFGWGD